MNCLLGFHKTKHPSYNLNKNFYKKRSQSMSKSIMSSFAVLFISTKIVVLEFSYCLFVFILGGIKCNNKLFLHIRFQAISDKCR